MKIGLAVFMDFNIRRVGDRFLNLYNFLLVQCVTIKFCVRNLVLALRGKKVRRFRHFTVKRFLHDCYSVEEDNSCVIKFLIMFD